MKSSKKIISLLLAVIIALSLPLYSFAVSKEEIQADLEAEIAKKEQEIANYQQKIDAFKNDASKQEEYIDELQKQIDAYDDEINLNNIINNSKNNKNNVTITYYNSVSDGTNNNIPYNETGYTQANITQG